MSYEPNAKLIGRGAFGMLVGQCDDCHKLVHVKPVLGSLHVCLSPEERDRMRRGRIMAENQRRPIKAVYGCDDTLASLYRIP